MGRKKKKKETKKVYTTLQKIVKTRNPELFPIIFPIRNRKRFPKNLKKDKIEKKKKKNPRLPCNKQWNRKNSSELQ